MTDTDMRDLINHCGFCGRKAGEPCPESLQWRRVKGLPGAKPAPCFPEKSSP